MTNLKEKVQAANEDLQNLVSYAEEIQNPFAVQIQTLALRRDKFLDTFALIDQQAWRMLDSEYMRFLSRRCEAQIEKIDRMLEENPPMLHSEIGVCALRFSHHLKAEEKEALSNVPLADPESQPVVMGDELFVSRRAEAQRAESQR